MKRILLGIMLCALFLPGCKKSEGEELSAEHQALIVEFEKYKVEQCACKDYECSHALGQKIGPRIVEVMSNAKKLPKIVQMKLGSTLKQMTECAERTKQPE
jgi:hypothetical protein